MGGLGAQPQGFDFDSLPEGRQVEKKLDRLIFQGVRLRKEKGGKKKHPHSDTSRKGENGLVALHHGSRLWYFWIHEHETARFRSQVFIRREQRASSCLNNRAVDR